MQLHNTLRERKYCNRRMKRHDIQVVSMPLYLFMPSCFKLWDFFFSFVHVRTYMHIYTRSFVIVTKWALVLACSCHNITVESLMCPKPLSFQSLKEQHGSMKRRVAGPPSPHRSPKIRFSKYQFTEGVTLAIRSPRLVFVRGVRRANERTREQRCLKWRQGGTPSSHLPWGRARWRDRAGKRGWGEVGSTADVLWPPQTTAAMSRMSVSVAAPSSPTNSNWTEPITCRSRGGGGREDIP